MFKALTPYFQPPKEYFVEQASAKISFGQFLTNISTFFKYL